MTSESRDRAITISLAVLAFCVSALSFYRSFIYTKLKLDLMVTDVSYVTNQGELYMTVAFSNAGNRDAAVLRLEPALWGRQGNNAPEWIPLNHAVAPNVPLANPKVPLIVRGGGLELVTLASAADPDDVERSTGSSSGFVFLGLRAATMNSDGNLFFVQVPVAKLSLDSERRILRAEPAIHRSLSGFSDLAGAPPGDALEANKQTPFVWVDRHY